jgi:hypothetical protein
MMDVVLDPEFSLDQVANPGAGPQIRGKPCTLRTLQKAPLKLALLAGGQLGRTTGRRPGHDPGVPLLKKARLPAANGSSVNLYFLGDIYRSESLLKERDCLKTSLFQLRWAAVWSHAYSIGH